MVLLYDAGSWEELRSRDIYSDRVLRNWKAKFKKLGFDVMGIADTSLMQVCGDFRRYCDWVMSNKYRISKHFRN